MKVKEWDEKDPPPRGSLCRGEIHDVANQRERERERESLRV
jgi:hypothetical protein